MSHIADFNLEEEALLLHGLGITLIFPRTAVGSARATSYLCLQSPAYVLNDHSHALSQHESVAEGSFKYCFDVW